VKSFYLPMLFRPAGFAQGLRVLFGDQVIFCKRKAFEAVGGYDATLPIMEDADLCVRLHHPAQKRLHTSPGERLPHARHTHASRSLGPPSPGIFQRTSPISTETPITAAVTVPAATLFGRS